MSWNNGSTDTSCTGEYACGECDTIDCVAVCGECDIIDCVAVCGECDTIDCVAVCDECDTIDCVHFRRHFLCWEVHF